MELSILIPVYRYDCSRLVAALHRLCREDGVDYEVLTADDERLRLGRAGIRNHLAERAQGTWLLFIDCDAAVDDDAFIRRYRVAMSSGVSVVCGGLRHAASLPSPAVSLRWRYERAADRHRSADIRSRKPYDSFTPFNLLVRREVFLSIRFDDSLKGYGHEDTLFGAELKRRQVPLLHIDNPLVHEGLEPNDIFLEKSRQALRNLKLKESLLADQSTLLRAYRLLCRWHLRGAVQKLFRHRRTRWEHRLTDRARPSLLLFKLYKLGYFAQL